LVYLVGQVEKPGNHLPPQGATLTPAALIANAGGITGAGDLSRMRVTRIDPKTGQTSGFVFDEARVRKGESGVLAQAATFALKPDDIVFVPAHGQ